MRSFSLFLFLLLCVFHGRTISSAKSNNKKLVVENLTDGKDLKKLLRTKTNVLVCFYNSFKQSQNVIKLVREVAESVKGEGTLALVDCSGEAKKMCKKLKIPSNEPHLLKHYKDGDFNKNYDRKFTLSSMINFMRDPTGDIPWEEDESATDVVHIPDSNSLTKFLKKESKPILIMFYAPWCGYCKTLKPEFAEAATELKDHSVLAAIDVNRPENTGVRMQYNITGFPTMQYFTNGAMKFTYEGDNKREAIVSFMMNPSPPPVKQRETEWSDTDSEVVHLTTDSFDPVIKEEASVVVMFYAPWCGHCKRMKPEYEKAAAIMKRDGIPGMLAAVDATKEPSVASRFSVKGYPTIMYFSYGEQKFELNNVRDAPLLVAFMNSPKEPVATEAPAKEMWPPNHDVTFLTDETFKPFLKKKKHAIVLFFAPWCAHCQKAIPEFAQASMAFKNDPQVAFAAVECPNFGNLCSDHNVKVYPTFMYYSYYSKVTKIYKGGRTKEDFKQFMMHPETNPVAPPSNVSNQKWENHPDILQLNDKNFNNELKKKEIVLVMFYAPWCGHCKKIKPEYVSAAKELKAQGLEDCLAMVDCSENRQVMEQYNIEGFPTLMLFKKGVFVKNYSGTRTMEEITRFVREQHDLKNRYEL